MRRFPEGGDIGDAPGSNQHRDTHYPTDRRLFIGEKLICRNPQVKHFDSEKNQESADEGYPQIPNESVYKQLYSRGLKQRHRRKERHVKNNKGNIY